MPNMAARRKRGRGINDSSDEDSDEALHCRLSVSGKGKARESEREREGLAFDARYELYRPPVVHRARRLSGIARPKPG